MRRWEELRPEFDKRDVQIVTVSTDTVADLQKGRSKHGLGALMLSDRDLAVTDLFGLRNQKIHSGPPGPRLPVPTSLLVSSEGKVVWMDQSENYQRRSDPDYVLGALREHLG